MSQITTAYRALRSAEPRIRARDAAGRLGVSEAALVASGSLGAVRRLVADFRGILEALPALGEVLVLCRNEAAVHEKEGPFTPPEFPEGSALVHGGPIDLRLFPDRWASAFALQEETKQGTRRSLQFFDAHGTAVLKLFLDARPEARGDAGAFDDLVATFAAGAPEALEILPIPARKNTAAEPVDVGALRAAWSALQDTHDFFGMLRRLRVERVRAFRSVGADFALPLRGEVLATLLQEASARKLPIMVFVGNRGAIQIHTGPVDRIVPMDHWLNVLDPGLNLHVDTRRIHEVFRVVKPTADGPVTSIEFFDEAGEAIALFFGERKPGREELAAWRELVAEVERRHA